MAKRTINIKVDRPDAGPPFDCQRQDIILDAFMDLLKTAIVTDDSNLSVTIVVTDAGGPLRYTFEK